MNAGLFSMAADKKFIGACRAELVVQQPTDAKKCSGIGSTWGQRRCGPLPAAQVT